MATRPFRQLSTGDYRGIFTKEEACSGIEGLKIKALNRATSAGYPYVLDVKNGKKEFFGANDEFYYESEKCIELFDRVDYVVESAKKGERLMHVFVDFLKDETRPHAKVDAGATRCISSAPLDYVIAWRMYFGAFMASMFKHHTDSGMCPGINPYNEWWRLAANLSRHGERTFDGDFKRFDSSEQPSLHWRILDFVNRWYDDGPENARVREILWYDLVHSRHLGGLGTDQKYLYQWNKALPSGHPFTTPVNSLYSLITLTACYVDATGDMMNMWDHVYIATFGDDNITNVDAATSEIFNQETVCASMKRLFNLTYTSGRKDGKIVPYTTLGECTFLKRTFTRDDLGSGGWLAPLDPASFLYTSYYYRNTRDARGDMLTNLESGLGELAFHSVEMWDKYYPLFKQTIAEAGEVPAFETREAYREMLRARTDAWF
uniref:RdRp catalytic domain-containing protein n=1 Tax=Qianjiang dicistro-like virus 57 TaxID=3239335 RepID=A0AB39JCL4_9VIRU